MSPLVLLLAAAALAAACPINGTVSADTHAVGCADLWLTVAADNVTLVIEGATGSINVTSNAAGTTLRLIDSTVNGNITLNGPNAFADVRRSTVTGTEVLLLSGARNATIAVADSTLTGAVVASVRCSGSAIGVSVAIANSTLKATRYAASVVGATIRDVAVVVTDSRLALNGSDNTGVVALAAPSVSNAAVNVTASSITCKAGDYVGVLGTGNTGVTWTNVTVSATLSNVTSTAGYFVGVLGAAAWTGGVIWTNVTVSAALANVTSTAIKYVGVLGAASCLHMAWTDVTVFATLANVTSNAPDFNGVLGAVSNDVTWTNVSVSAARADVTSTAGTFVGVLGTGSTTVAWTDVTVSAVLANVTSTAWLFVGVLGAGSGVAMAWTNVVVSAANANIISTASSFVGVLGAGSNNDTMWTNVTVSAVMVNVTSTATSYAVGVLGSGSGTGIAAWTNVAVSAANASIAATATNFVGILGVGSNSSMTWTNVTISAASANVMSTAGSCVGVLGTGSNGSTTWTNATISATLAKVTSIGSDVVGVLGSGGYTGASTWTDASVSAASANVTSNAHDGAGVLGTWGVGEVSWTSVTLSADLANVTSHVRSGVGVLLAVSNGTVICTDVTVFVAPLSTVTSTFEVFHAATCQAKTLLTATSSDTPTQTSTATSSDTPTATPTQTSTATSSDTPTATPTQTSTATPTLAMNQTATSANGTNQTTPPTAAPAVADVVAVSVVTNVSMTVAFAGSFVAAGGVSMAQRAAGILAALRCPDDDMRGPSAWQHPLGVSMQAKRGDNLTDTAALYATAAVVDIVLWLPLSVVAVGALNVLLLLGMGVDDLDRSYLARVGGMASPRGLLFIARVPSCVLLPSAWFLGRALESSTTAVSASGGDGFAIGVLSLVSLLSVATVLWVFKVTWTPGEESAPGVEAGDRFPVELIDLVLPRHAPKIYSFVMGSKEWVPTTYEDGSGIRANRPFHRRNAAFYEDCLPTRKWFLAVDLATSFLVSAVSNVRSGNGAVCLAVQATVLATAILSLVLILALRPHRVPADFGHAVFVGGTTVAAGCLSVVEATRPYASAVASAAVASAGAKLFLVVAALVIQRLPAVRSELQKRVAELAQAKPKRTQTFVANASPLLLEPRDEDGPNGPQLPSEGEEVSSRRASEAAKQARLEALLDDDYEELCDFHSDGGSGRGAELAFLVDDGEGTCGSLATPRQPCDARTIIGADLEFPSGTGRHTAIDLSNGAAVNPLESRDRLRKRGSRRARLQPPAVEL